MVVGIVAADSGVSVPLAKPIAVAVATRLPVVTSIVLSSVGGNFMSPL
jgi:hypothetical protein